jgi:hypothetical protein
VPSAQENSPSVYGCSRVVLRLDRDLSDRLCVAIVAQITFGGNIIETGTDSYRLAQTRAQAERRENYPLVRPRAHQVVRRASATLITHRLAARR